ncbi:MAG: VWA domain-containing protein, partial [Planctomycetota bacterium]
MRTITRQNEGLVLLTCCAVLLTFLSACTGGGAAFQAESAHVITGRVVDESGAPVAGALVSVDGVQAGTGTDADGVYVVHSAFEPRDDAVLVTVSKSGHEDTLAVRRRSTSGRVSDIAEPLLLPLDRGRDRIQITGPLEGAIVKPDDDCLWGVDVTGYAHRDELIPNNDLVILIDASGSTADPSGASDGSTIFQQQIAAARLLVASLQPYAHRAAVVRFATAPTVVQGFTDNPRHILAALDELALQGPETRGDAAAASDFREALLLAKREFEEHPWTMPDPDDEAAVPVAVASHRRVLLFTDGIPTLPVEPGLTQEAGDVYATLDAAQALRDVGIAVHGFAIGPAVETNRLTTLPAVAVMTGGAYHAINSQADL